jgi:hypothetical protein
VDADAFLAVVPYALADGARLASPVLTLHLEEIRGQEKILVLKCAFHPLLLQGNKEHSIPWQGDKPAIPPRGDELFAKVRWDLLTRLTLP